MNVSARLSRGKADPFGLLVLAVMLAWFITVGIQAQASQAGETDRDSPSAFVEHAGWLFTGSDSDLLHGNP